MVKDYFSKTKKKVFFLLSPSTIVKVRLLFICHFLSHFFLKNHSTILHCTSFQLVYLKKKFSLWSGQIPSKTAFKPSSQKLRIFFSYIFNQHSFDDLIKVNDRSCSLFTYNFTWLSTKIHWFRLLGLRLTLFDRFQQFSRPIYWVIRFLYGRPMFLLRSRILFWQFCEVYSDSFAFARVSIMGNVLN